jgi:peptidoglycan/LPS O-acetylase OafA/YrhL
MTQKQEIWAESHLNAIRGLAALAVVLGHARVLFFPPLTAVVAAEGGGRRATLGQEAVMVFFVLSGYLVGGSVLRSLRRGRWSWRDYLVKRLVRLWIVLIPAITIGILLDSLGAQLFGGAGSLYTAPAGQDFVTASALVTERDGSVILGNLLFLQTILVPPIGTNTPLWSLANEFWYYLAFPLLLIALLPAFRLTVRLASGAAALAILALIGGEADLLFLPWLAGAAVSRIPRIIPRRWQSIATWGAAAAMAATLVLAKKYVGDLHGAELVVGLVAACLVYVVACQDRLGDTGLYGRVSAFLARLSYTLYLTHLPFMIFGFAAISGAWLPQGVSPGSLATCAGLVLAALVWAWGLYRLFESRTDAVRGVVMKTMVSA